MSFPEETGRRDVAAQLRDFGRILREQFWLVGLCILLAGFGAAAYSSSQQKIYEAQAKLLLQQDTLGPALVGTGITAYDPVRQAATDSQLVSLPAVAVRVQKRLRQPIAPATVNSGTSGDSNVLTVTVQDPDAQRAATIANAFATEYIAFRSSSNKQRFQSALRTVQTRLAQLPRKSPNAATLRSSQKQLQLLSSLQTGDAQVIQQAVPSASPVKPKPVRNIVLAVIAGALLGIALAFLRDRLDRRVKKVDQLEALLPGVPVIGWIPKLGRGRTAKARAADAFYALRTNLRYVTPDGPLNALLVTSAMAGEGKSSVVLNLALAVSEQRSSVLIVDADLRRPALSRRLGADPRVGVSRILAGEAGIEASVQRHSVEPSRNGSGPAPTLSGELAVVPAGPPAPNPQILLTDHALANLIESARGQSDFVIVDGPPIGAVSDMLPVARSVDGVILVVRLYHSRKDILKRFSGQLANASVRPLGVVVVDARGEGDYHYDYSAQ